MSIATRRSFLVTGACGASAVLTAGALAGRRVDDVAAGPEGVPEVYPTTDADRAREFVGACHFQIDKVRAMLAEEGGLAGASWDWGFGDWETGIGAASHTGQRAIIEMLVAHGARPTVFTLAALDEIDGLRAVLENVPGADQLEGPHSISLFDHARAGKATRVMEYLEAKGMKRENPFSVERSFTEPYVGAYAWGLGRTERFEVFWNERMSSLSLRRPGMVSRALIPLSDHLFSPAGARSVKLRFEMSDGAATRLIAPRVGGELIARRA